MNAEKNTWRDFIAEERAKPYFDGLRKFVDAAYAAGTVYPPRDKVYAAFELTSFEDTKVVILGQDPYHEPQQAQGLAFYVPDGVRPPPSLVNIAKEIKAEREGLDASKLKSSEVEIPDLVGWARQGVLLLNATLTVAAGEPMSHRGYGWEQFTDAAIARLSSEREHLVFMLWGSHAQAKGAAIDRTRHLVIECAHPSPLSARRGFFSSGCFMRCNDYLRSQGQLPIEW